MRGATDARETLGAQQLKTQYGSTRIRDKQEEMVRIARDLVQIVAEIITEKFDPVTMIEMSQTQLPTQEMQQQQVQQLQQQIGNQQLAMQKMQQLPAGAADRAAEARAGDADHAAGPAAAAAAARTPSRRSWRKPTIEQVLNFFETTARARSCSTSRPTARS